MNDTSGSTPLAQSSSKAMFGTDSGVGLAGLPIPPGVPSPNRVPFMRIGLSSAGGRIDVLLKFANHG